MSDKMFELTFNLKFQSKQLNKAAAKAEKEHDSYKKKVAARIAKGDLETAKIFAADAIRKRNESLGFMRMASRLDAVRNRVEAMKANQQVVKALPGVVKGIEKSMESMNLQQMTAVMDKFSSQFEDLEVQSEYVQSTMSSATTLSTPQDQVDALIEMTAQEHALNLSELLPAFQRADPVAAPAAASSSTAKTKTAVKL